MKSAPLKPLILPPDSSDKEINHDFREFFESITRRIHHLISDETQVNGAEKFPEDGPNLVLLNHDGRYDFWTYPGVWKKHLNDLVIKAVARKGLIPIKPLDDLILGSWLNPVVIQNVTRINKNWGQEKKAYFKAENEKAVKEVAEEIRKGISIIFAASGTTHGDGYFPEPKVGAQKLSHSNGFMVGIVPTEANYDYFAGSRNIFGRPKTKSYVSFGPKYYHQPEFEEDGMYTQRNRAEFNEKLVNSWRDLNTFSPSQIIGLIADAFSQKNLSLHAADALEFADNVVEVLEKSGVNLDKDLLDLIKREEIILQVYDEIIRRGYIDQRSRKINAEKLNATPSKKEFKKKNPLGYMKNRADEALTNKSELRASIQRILES